MEINKPFVNKVDLDQQLIDLTQKNNKCRITKQDFTYINNFLSTEEVIKWIHFIKSQERIPVGLDGIKDNYRQGDSIGSYRLSIFDEVIVKLWWDRISHLFDNITLPYNYIVENSSNTQKTHWQPIGINPLLRVIEYQQGGSLAAHYDAPFKYNKDKTTLKSLIIYLTTNKEGQTEFVIDEQNILPQNKKDFSDQLNYQGLSQINLPPISGQAIAFNHRMLHRVRPIENEEKIIIRTDIVYQRI